MKTYYPIRIPGIINMLLVSFLFLLSCNKVEIFNRFEPLATGTQDLSKKVNSSVSGFITNENGQPLAAASVYAGSSSTTTDQYGYFEIKNTQVIQNAAFVTVERAGYFKGIKTYIATAGEDAFFRIQLIPKIIVGIFNSASGGSVAAGKNLAISFQPDGIINATTGAAYSGNVNVAAYRIDPVANDLYKIMPGDQRGISSDGVIKGLTTYGMAAVELSGSSGELLQIAPGKKATLKMTLPASLLQNAPSSIPLWYFDEKTGLWSEQGSASRTGDTYSGEVSHFSFWNFDKADTYVHFSCTVRDVAGNPLVNTLVKISRADDPNSAGYGFTNSDGFVSGAVPANTGLNLEIKGGEQCGTPVYTQQFSTTGVDLSLGIIIVDAKGGLAFVSGTITGCDAQPVNNGVMILQKDGQYYRFTSDNKGSYRFTTPLCSSSAIAGFTAYDVSTNQYSNEVNQLISISAPNRVDLKACGNTSAQFINYTINGVSYKFTYPADNFAPVTPDQNFTFLASNNMYEAGFQFTGTDILSNSTRPLNYFMASQIQEPLIMVSPVMVTLTERGENDQFFAGNFTGSFVGSGADHKIYTISCSFRVKCIL